MQHKFHHNNTINDNDNDNENTLFDHNIQMQSMWCCNKFMMSLYDPLWCHNAIPLFCDDVGALLLFRAVYCTRRHLGCLVLLR